MEFGFLILVWRSVCFGYHLPVPQEFLGFASGFHCSSLDEFALEKQGFRWFLFFPCFWVVDGGIGVQESCDISSSVAPEFLIVSHSLLVMAFLCLKTLGVRFWYSVFVLHTNLLAKTRVLHCFCVIDGGVKIQETERCRVLLLKSLKMVKTFPMFRLSPSPVSRILGFYSGLWCSWTNMLVTLRVLMIVVLRCLWV